MEGPTPQFKKTYLGDLRLISEMEHHESNMKTENGSQCRLNAGTAFHDILLNGRES